MGASGVGVQARGDGGAQPVAAVENGQGQIAAGGEGLGSRALADLASVLS